MHTWGALENIYQQSGFIGHALEAIQDQKQALFAQIIQQVGARVISLGKAKPECIHKRRDETGI